MAALQGGALVVHFTNRKNAPLLFSTRPGTRPKVEHGEPPTYKALMSKIVHREYFALPGVEVGTKEEEHLKNILGDRAFECWEVDLTPPLLGFSESPPTAKQH